MHELTSSIPCSTRLAPPRARRERGVLAVIALTAVMMILEIAVGYASGSMALLADGWHMATHVAALGLAGAAYALARRYASHRSFAFGTGKFHALAGYTSALVLGMVALGMMAQSVERLRHPRAIDVAESLPVALLGLVVNLASIWLLHSHDDDRDHDFDGHHHAAPDAHVAHHQHHDAHHHDHNHRAALLHVVADALTSALAVGALLAARTWGWLWPDAIAGMLGGIVIAKWSIELCRATGGELLDVCHPPRLEDEIRSALEAIDDVKVNDLHVWPLGRGAKSCVLTLVSAAPRDVSVYRERLAPFSLSHLTIEVRRCVEGH